MSADRASKLPVLMETSSRQDVQRAIEFAARHDLSGAINGEAALTIEATRLAVDSRYAKIMRVMEQSGPITYRSMYWDQVLSFTPRYRGSLAYVTGAHNMKVGFDAYHNASRRNYQRGKGLAYRFNRGVPNRLTLLFNDFTERAHVRNLAFYGQDRWTLGRFTLQGGVRYERARSTSPEQRIGPSQYIPNQIVFEAQDLVKELLERMRPFLYGGDMISRVSVEKSEWNELPWKFEAGTMAIAVSPPKIAARERPNGTIIASSAAMAPVSRHS